MPQPQEGAAEEEVGGNMDHMLFLPTWVYEAMASGAILKGVTCEHCGQQYAYLMCRAITAESRGHDHAASFAAEALKWELTQGTDVVPCPACGALQAEMINVGRRRWKPRSILASIGLGLFIIGAILCFWEVGLGLTLAGAGVLLLLRRAVALCSRHLLNRNAATGSLRDTSRQPPPAWIRQELEQMAAEHPQLNIADALLDWEGQKIRRNSCALSQ